MKIQRLSLSVAITVACVAPFSLAHAEIVAKQLAGAPSEFANMKAVDPADAAIHSKSAVIPFELGADKAGGYSATLELPVEGTAMRFLVLSNGALDWNTAMRAPGATRLKDARELATQVGPAQFGMEKASHGGEYYAFAEIEPGDWQLKISSPSGSNRQGFVILEGESDTQLVSYLAHSRQLAGERIGIVASLYGKNKDGTLDYGKAAGSVSAASMRVTDPAGNTQVYAMYDDGQHADGAAGDGIYGGNFLAADAGQYLAQVTVRGTNAYGLPIVRSAEHPLPVVAPSIRLTATKASAVSSNGERLSLRIPVQADKAGQHYRGYAEVWGTGADGQPVAVAWVGGMVTPNAGTVDFGLDSRWIQLAAARAPFELRNLRLEDVNGYITVAAAQRLELATEGTAIKSYAGEISIDERMTMGERPASLNADKGVGSRLLLVHGYCSGGVWPAGQFTNASTFLDANQNRSHDQFARLIQSFGNTWNSFGVVAHSQGGAASLHLYTYYWSGLDRAVGSRLIQSVGTPYQGTNLAGILATLGSWFGVGCGTNNDLSYSGGAAWLAGIPTSARAKVNYYTTAFRTTNWWTNDYCQIATDLVLSDPEDGTTEQARGQVSGAINRGHVTGQCHTSGMRDPAQFLDSSRNSVMNTNAAR